MLHKQRNLYQYKQKKLLAGEIAKLAFEWDMNELAIKACEFVISDKWEAKNSEEMILIQAECNYIMAQIYVDILTKDNFEIAFQQAVRIQTEDKDVEKEILTNEKLQQVKQMKKDIVKYFIAGLQLAESIQ